ncbi:MAG: hypothetical protein WEE64_03865 [Dehalococcoidia bacterium]
MQGTRWFGLAGAIAALLALALFAGACDDDEGGADATATEPAGAEATATEPAGGPSSESAVDISLTEFSVTADPTSTGAGSVTFNVANVGGTPHELVVIKTDLDPADLPTADDGTVDEAQVDVIGEIEEDELPAQTGEGELTLDLEAGSYALICNVLQEVTNGEPLAHYTEGMHTAFEVTE